METQETIIEETKKKPNSIRSDQNDDDYNDNEKDAYFLILKPSEEKIDFASLKYEAENIIDPSIIFPKPIDKEDETYPGVLVFKFKRKKKEKSEENKELIKSTKYMIKFYKEEQTYIITFVLKDECFAYIPELNIGNKYLEDMVIPEPIEQDIVPLYDKLNIFLKALQKNGENHEEKLYEDTINLYEEKKQFSLMIALFLKIYEKRKELCDKLIEIFNKYNEESADKVNYLKKDLNSFKQIYSNAKEIVKERKYNPIYFYGVLFCYLHFYDKDNFPKTIAGFLEGNSEILFEILIQYYSHFMNPLKQNKEFYNKFIKYELKKEKKDSKTFENILEYVEDIEAYLFVINSNKEKIFKKYKEFNDSPIELSGNLELKKYTNDFRGEIDKSHDEDNKSRLDNVIKLENECSAIIKLIEEIIDYSKKENILVIYLKTTFWSNLINEYSTPPNLDNINNIYELRKLFKKYNSLVNELYKNNNDENKNAIKGNINGYLERDEFSLALNKLIKELFEDKKTKLTNAEILGVIGKYNPYYSLEDEKEREKFKNKRNVYIFDKINFDKITVSFIKTYKHLRFEKMFEENIIDYIHNLTGKIKNIQTFGNIIKLVDEEKIQKEKQFDYFKILEDKYKSIVIKDIKLIEKEKELNEAIKIVSEFVVKACDFYNNNEFIENIENNKDMDDKIKSLIYLELINEYKDKKNKSQKNKIYDIYLEKLDTKDGRENIIKLVQKLNDDDKINFIYEKFLEKCEFTKEEFFSNHKNDKIQALCLLQKEMNIISNGKDKVKGDMKSKEIFTTSKIMEMKDKNKNKFAERLYNILNQISDDLERENITKKNLEIFLNMSEESDPYVKDKLELITLITPKYNKDLRYDDYKAIIVTINKKLGELKFIKDSLMIFHRNNFGEDIKSISNTLKEIDSNPVRLYKTDKIQERINVYLKKHMTLCNEIKELKDFLLFKKIYENAMGKDQSDRFNNAKKKLENLKKSFAKNTYKNIEVIFNEKEFETTFQIIKEELSSTTEKNKSQDFIDQMIKYFDIKQQTVKDDLTMIINSKRYEMILKSIIYFFDNFFNQQLDWPKNKDLSKMNLETLKIILKDLKHRKIYDYTSNSSYYRIFTSSYGKKQAIDFLKENINIAIDSLKKNLINNLDPTNRKLSIKDINDTCECLNQLKILEKLDALGKLNHIQRLNERQIKSFENYMAKFASIIELNSKNNKNNPFQKVYDIIKNATLYFNLDNEDFGYTKDNNEEKIENIEELIKLKEKINIQPKKTIKENIGTNEINQTSEITEKIEEEDELEIKRKKLLFFRNTVINLEIIYDKINTLRSKGFNIPIDIIVEIKYPDHQEDSKNSKDRADPGITYYLYGKKKEFDQIKDYLFKVKNDYEKKINENLKSQKYLRLLYGKLFRIIKQYQESNGDISELIRYILNKANYTDKIKKGKIYNTQLGKDLYENKRSK